MPFIEELCKEMSNNPNILTFSEIAMALSEGAVLGQKTQVPGGVVIGATLNLSLEAGKRAMAIADEMMDELKQRTVNKPRA